MSGETKVATCRICGEPMPPGEQMFKFHGYSGNCPKPPLPKLARSPFSEKVKAEADDLQAIAGDYSSGNPTPDALANAERLAGASMALSAISELDDSTINMIRDILDRAAGQVA